MEPSALSVSSPPNMWPGKSPGSRQGTGKLWRQGGAAHGLGAARDKWSGAGACRTAAGCSPRTNGSRGRGPGPGPCWSVSCVPRKGVLRDPRPLRLWLSSPVVAWPSTLTKPRCAGIGRPNSQPQPACANAQQPQPGPVATRRLVVVVDEDHPLNRRTPQGRAFLATSVPESFLAVTLGHLRHQLP